MSYLVQFELCGKPPVFGTLVTCTKPLTKRQAEVLQLKANGLSDKQVAHELGVSVDRVNQINQSIRAYAEELTGVHYENLIGAAFALQLAGSFEYEPLPSRAELLGSEK